MLENYFLVYSQLPLHTSFDIVVTHTQVSRLVHLHERFLQCEGVTQYSLYLLSNVHLEDSNPATCILYTHTSQHSGRLYYSPSLSH